MGPNWGHPAIIFFLAAGVALSLTKLAVRLALAFGIVDLPSARKVHERPIPRIGGVAIAAAVLIAFALALFKWDFASLLAPGEAARLFTLFAGASVLVAIGFVDDIVGVGSEYKLMALMVAAGAFCASGGLIREITIQGHSLVLPTTVSWSFTLLWIVAITVSISFIDGLDGLAAGIILIASAMLALVCGLEGYQLGMFLSLATAGALAGFLVLNTYPAKIFMGDCGSLFLGYLFACTCVLATTSVGSTRSLILPCLTLAIPLFDLLFTMIRRGVLDRRSLFAAERGHIHHRLLDTGLCHQHVVWLLYAATVASAGLSLICIFGDRAASAMASVVYGIALLVLFRTAGSLRAREILTAIRRNRAISKESNKSQAAFCELQIGFRRAETFGQWWEQLCRAAEMFQFAKVDLPVVTRDKGTKIYRWRRDDELLAALDSVVAEIPVPQRRSQQTMRAQVEVLVTHTLESAGQRVALFCRLIGENGLDNLWRRNGEGMGAKTATSDALTAGDAKPQAKKELPDPGAFPGFKVAIVHDFLYVYAGAERVLEQIINLFPQADVFSLFDFLPTDSRGFLRNKTVHVSFLQKLPFVRRRHRLFLPVMPLAIEQLDVSSYDLVISSSYLAAKGVLTRSDQLHVCYCHTPARFAWDLQRQYLSQTGMSGGIKGGLANLILHYIRSWDVRSAAGVDVFLTNSDYIRRRIQKIYRREATTVYPPVDVDYFSFQPQKQDYYLTVSRMVPYKRIDLIVEAFAKMPNRRLLVVGDGPDMEYIRSKAGANTTFLGAESDERVREHMQRARAFVFAAEEDFGITLVEAQACGTPVIAYGRGGATESVIEGETGLFFEIQSCESLIDTVDRFEQNTWDYGKIRTNAERFSAQKFREHFVNCIRREWGAFMAERTMSRLPIGVVPLSDSHHQSTPNEQEDRSISETGSVTHELPIASADSHSSREFD